ncbi:hypothetical protein [Planctomicrobium sp. SH527]|uniref:hypothetical protein n=1 Tax=Planctomicrobium sp. SH527 TaxID=3448123 RepID=UPI003F5B2A09
MADEFVEGLMRDFGRYLVCLAYFRNVNPKADFHPGVILELAGKWWFATAGHIFHDLERCRTRYNVIAEDFRLIDHFGHGSDRQGYIPFDFMNARKFYEFSNERRIDWGIVELDAHTVRLLQANDVGMLTESEWSKHSKEHEGYFMLGFPAVSHNVTATEFTIRANPKTTAIHIERADDCREGEHLRFSGRLPKCDIPIEGMSGGPIFGLVADSVEIIALQSSWLSESQTIFGTFLTTLSKLAEVRIQA